MTPALALAESGEIAAAARASAPADQHMPQLDGIRCYAAVAVVAHHVFLGRYLRLGTNGIGVYAVWLFFTLSGFLITGILLRGRDSAAGHPRSVLRAFYARRFLRIMPVYYAVLFISAAVGMGRSFRHDFVWHVSYMSNWLMAYHGTWAEFASPLWSLGVEEQFYLIWPTIVLFAPRRRLFSIFVTAVLVGVLSRLLLALVLFNHGSSVTVIAPSTSNLDPLALGALLALHRHSAPMATESRQRWTTRALVAGAALFAVIEVLTITGRAVQVLLVGETFAAALMSVWLVDRAATGFAPSTIGARLLNARVARYLGTISYGVYVMHGSVRWLFAQTPLRAALAQRGELWAAVLYFLIVLAGTITIASLSWYAFESPINGLKRYFPYAKREPAAPVVAAVVQS